jgi:hypothetical protein
MLNAAQRVFAERELLRVENKTLIQQNNEKKARKQVKEKKIGDAKIMSFDDILEAKRSRECAEAETARKKNERERKKAERERKKAETEEKKAEKDRQKAVKDQAKAEKGKEKAGMAKDKAARAKRPANTGPQGNDTRPARKKRASIGEAELGLRDITNAGLSAFCTVLSFEPPS